MFYAEVKSNFWNSELPSSAIDDQQHKIYFRKIKTSYDSDEHFHQKLQEKLDVFVKLHDDQHFK